MDSGLLDGFRLALADGRPVRLIYMTRHPAAIQLLIDAVSDSSRRPVPGDIIPILGLLKERRSLPGLLEVFKSRENSYGVDVDAIAAIGDPRAAPILAESLKHELGRFSRARVNSVVRALGVLGDENVVEVLVRVVLAHGKGLAVSQEGLDEGHTKGEAIEALETILAKRAAAVRLDLLEELSRLPSEIKFWHSYLEDEESGRYTHDTRRLDCSKVKTIAERERRRRRATAAT
jgi:HEAT repeat protein